MTTHILIADTDSVLTEVYRDYLTERGFTVRTAADGLGCVAQLRRSRPTLLVLGTSLLWGDCEGVLDVMDEERHLRPEIVIVLAPPRQWHLVRRLKSYGIDSVQWRPLAPVRLVRYVEAMLVEQADRQRSFSDLLPETTKVPAHGDHGRHVLPDPCEDASALSNLNLEVARSERHGASRR